MARRSEGQEGHDRNLYVRMHVVTIEKSIVCAYNKVLIDFVSKRGFLVSISGRGVLRLSSTN